MSDIKILLVDDEVDLINTLSNRLDLRDLDNETAFDGKQALSAVDENEPDVMVLDLKMPGIDWMEVLRRVRKTYHLSRLLSRPDTEVTRMKKRQGELVFLIISKNQPTLKCWWKKSRQPIRQKEVFSKS